MDQTLYIKNKMVTTSGENEHCSNLNSVLFLTNTNILYLNVKIKLLGSLVMSNKYRHVKFVIRD